MGRIIERIVAYEVWGDNDIGFSKQLNEGELLVRCKDCKHWDKDINGHIDVNDHLCRRHLWWTMETDYCSYGERSEP